MFHTTIWFWLLILAIFFITIFIVVHEIHRRDLNYVVPWWLWTFGGMGALLLLISILTYTIMSPPVVHPHPLESLWLRAQEERRMEPEMFWTETQTLTPCSYHPRSSLPNTLLVDLE
jgi:hypothetical protein